MTDTWAAKVLDGVPTVCTYDNHTPPREMIWRDDALAAIARMGREMALDVLASSGQAQEAYAAQLAAEAERDSLRERVARLEGERDDALTFLDNAVSKSPQPLKDLGAYLASLLDEDQWPQAERYLNAAVKSFAALTDGGKDE